MGKNNWGGARKGSGRRKKSKYVPFRVLIEFEDEVREILKNMTTEEKTKIILDYGNKN